MYIIIYDSISVYIIYPRGRPGGRGGGGSPAAAPPRRRRIYIYIYIYDRWYYMFVLRSYRYFARAPQGSRKVPAREAASNPNEDLVT